MDVNRMKLQSLFALCFASSWCACAVAPLSPEAALVAHWIAGQQFHNAGLSSYGAIKNAQDAAAITADGIQYFCVSPYSANLTVLGLLQAGAPEGIPVAGHWIDWYFAHLNPQSAPEGVPDNHFYRLNGEGETTCIQPDDHLLCHYNDATDSAAATFFSVLWAAHEAGVPAASLNILERQQVEKLADALLKLQQPDGLCWAKKDYRVKYLEDNSEVFNGLCALADLERNVFHDAGRSVFYRSAAGRVQEGILAELYDPRAQLFRVAKFEDNTCPPANLDIWYPDTQAQLWPLLFGVIAPTDTRSQAIAVAVDKHWNGRIRPDWAANPEQVNQGWIEAGHAYAALLMGETNRVQIYVSAVRHSKFKIDDRAPQFASPFGVDDAGWLLRILTSPQINGK
jgi:hypothetical protein